RLGPPGQRADQLQLRVRQERRRPVHEHLEHRVGHLQGALRLMRRAGAGGRDGSLRAMGELRARHCLLALAAAGLVACQAAPPAPRPAVKDPGALAAAALEQGDHATAAALYRTALAAEPERLAFHYGLGVAASYLDRKTEAVREFTWVLERGEAGSSEVK